MNDSPSPNGGPPPSPRRRWLPFTTLSWEERKRHLNRQTWALALGCPILLLLAYSIPLSSTNDAKSTVLAFWGTFFVRMLTYHFGLILLPIFCVALLRRRLALCLVTAPLALLTVGISLSPGSSEPTEVPSLTVMSVNLFNGNQQPEKIVAEIVETNPDIIAFQEYTGPWHRALQEALGDSHPHHLYVTRSDSFGAAFYSRIPMTGKEVLELGESRVPALRITVPFQGDPLVLYNIHTLPPRLLDYVRTQRRQIRDLLRRLEDERDPTLLLGDFNWTQFNAHHHALRRAGFRESHEEAGSGLGSTWPALGFLRYLPGLRIDHVYLSEDLLCFSHRRGTGAGSDHRPIVTVVGPNPETMRSPSASAGIR